MRFWTVQPIAVWAQIDEGEAVRVDPSNARYGGIRPWQYDWLAAELAARSPGFTGGWPWWLLCEGPDLAQLASRKLPGGSYQASIELEIPSNRFVTFPLWMWETIYTGQYLAATREELQQWQDESTAATTGNRPLPEQLQTKLEESWERIFDPEWRPQFWYRDHRTQDDGSDMSRLMREASTQAAGLTEELRAGDVIAVAKFTAA